MPVAQAEVVLGQYGTGDSRLDLHPAGRELLVVLDPIPVGVHAPGIAHGFHTLGGRSRPRATSSRRSWSVERTSPML